MPDNDSILKKHSIVIAGHQTSVTLENIFWQQFKEIARARGLSLSKLIEDIDLHRQTNLSSAIRVFVLKEQMKT